MFTLNDNALDKPNYRQAGKEKSGRVFKGTIQDPLNRSQAASIPYKFETILYKNTNPRGFGASAQRFFLTEDLAPGPGSYAHEQAYAKDTAPSYSKKGFGVGFVSKSNRNLFGRAYPNTGPGPGTYSSIDKPFQVTHITPDPSNNTSRTTIDTLKSHAELPGPGHYHVNTNSVSTINKTPQISSVFKSTSLRNSESAKGIAPPPGLYEIDRDLSPKKPYKHYLNSAPFMMPTKKKMSEDQSKKELANQYLEKEQPIKGAPGPGHYFKENEDEVALFNQRLHDKISANFVAGNQTRFGEVIEKKARKNPTPGPAQYQPTIVFPPEKTLVSGSVFMSETARKPFGENKPFVGPTKYNPEPLPKKSYHLNINKQWV